MKQELTNTLKQCDNTPVVLKGTQKFMGKEIPVVLGGFGENQKVVTDKMVAEIHSMNVTDVRRRITDNIKRFKETVDYIDILNCYASDAQQLLERVGYSKMQIAKAEHIYFLSERGYAKLIKIMDTDLAWEIHDKLIDEYFQLREGKQQARRLTPQEELRLHYQVIEEQAKEIESVREEVTEVREEVTDLKDNMPLFNVECKDLQALVRKIGTKVLGGYKSNAYNNNSLRARVYRDIQNQLRREFGVEKYEAIKRSQLDIAKTIVEAYRTPVVLVTEISNLNNQMRLD